MSIFWGIACTRTRHGGRWWKTAVFPTFSTRKMSRCGMWKTPGRFFPIWRGRKKYAGANCKKRRKTFDFLFYKRQSAHFSSQKLARITALHYGVYKQISVFLWKTRWKKWKTSWETGLLFHKNGGKPGGKSEKFSPEWNFDTLFGCEINHRPAAFCCNGGPFSPQGRAPRRSARFFLNGPCNHGTISSYKRETSKSGGMAA